MPSFDFSFSWHFSLSFGPLEKVDTPDSPITADSSPPARPIDTKEPLLSPASLDLQRRIRECAQSGRRVLSDGKAFLEGRKQRTREYLSDLESLKQLEAATAAFLALSKANDRESLEVLLRCTRVQTIMRPPASYATPEMKDYWPKDRRDRINKAKQQSPLTDAAPFSTPSAVERELNAKSAHKDMDGSDPTHASSVSLTSSIMKKLSCAEPENEFEAFLRRTTSTTRRSGSAPSKKGNNGFSALLRSSTMPTHGKGPVQSMGSAYVQQHVDSVFEVMAQAKQADIDSGMHEDTSPGSSGDSSPESLNMSKAKRSKKVVTTAAGGKEDHTDVMDWDESRPLTQTSSCRCEETSEAISSSSSDQPPKNMASPHEVESTEAVIEGGSETSSEIEGSTEDGAGEKEVYVLAPSSQTTVCDEEIDGWEVIDEVMS